MSTHKLPHQRRIEVSSVSYASRNIRNFRKTILLMMLFPLSLALLSGIIFQANYRNTPKSVAQTTAVVTPETVVDNLDTVWSMQFAPDGKLYFTERNGNLKAFFNGQVKLVHKITLASESAEEGLQGIALHPNFASNGWLYAYYTYSDGSLKNRLVRFTLNPSTATVTGGPTTLIEGIPGYRFHNGGRIKFGPDGKLYVATGAATPDTVSQDPASLGGKILRVNDDGSGVADNPFSQNKRVWSMGHRNPQGLAWHPVTGEMWSTEHGPSSTAPYCCNDEVNKIVKGGNYGWPRYYGTSQQDSTYAGYNINDIKPLWISGTSGAGSKWAPGGALFYTGTVLGPPWTNSLIFAGLGGIDGTNRSLFRLRMSSDGRTPVQMDTLYKDTFGRLRDVTQGPDGAIYLSTSNRDGRGSGAADKIIRLKPVVATTPTPPPPAPAPTPTPPPSPPPASTQTPYTSSIALPGKIEAENYDKGGQGVAYNDSTTANQGGKYRTDGVDIEDSKEGGYSIGWVTSGEWLEYTINVAETAKYNVTFRLATPGSGTWQLKDGSTVLASATSGNTGGWYNWKDITINNVNLTAGTKILRLEVGSSVANINYVSFTKQGTSTPSPAPSPTPSPGTPSVPVIVVPKPDAQGNIPIPSNAPRNDEGQITADFNNDGLNDLAVDLNNDGVINPTTEIVIDGSTNPGLTDLLAEPLNAEIPNTTAKGSIAVNIGPVKNVAIPKPVAYTFVVTQAFAVTGLSAYLALTKLAFFAGLRAKMGL